MSVSTQPVVAPPIVLPLADGGHVQIVVAPNVYARYQDLRHHGVLSKEQLLRLATLDGAREATAETVTQSVLLPGTLIRERLKDLDRAMAAIRERSG